MKTFKYSILSMILKGIGIGCFWAVGNLVLDIPIFHYNNDAITISYCAIVSIIYVFLLRSRRYSYTMATWLISMPVAIFAFIILHYTPVYDVIHKIALQDYWDEWRQEYDVGFSGFGMIIFYPFYYATTFIGGMIAVIFSYPKRK